MSRPRIPSRARNPTDVSRSAVVIALPDDELAAVRRELGDAGFETVAVWHPDELGALLRERHDVAVAIIDGEADPGASLAFYRLLHDEGRDVPALMIVSPRTLDQLGNGTGTSDADEYFTRPYSAESLRWRVEAMCIRSQTVDDGSGDVLASGGIDADIWGRRATVITVFNAKGGVGKTTVATNLAAALQIRHGQQVLLVDADTVTGHVTTSLDLEQVPSVADAWRDEADGGPARSLTEAASLHESGMRVVALTNSPLHTEILDPERVAAAVNSARRGFDFIVVDCHPSYSHLNQAIFTVSDRILVPVTPDVPAVRATVQLREVAAELGVGERLALVVNRANSGVSVEDIERTVGMPALALIRSAGPLFLRAANEGKTIVERYPKEKATEDFDALAERVMGAGKSTGARRPAFGLFGRKEPVRA